MRLQALIDGWLTGWIKDHESSHPRAVYERAIAERQRQYQQLKQAVAGVLYMRNKIEAELETTTRELALVRTDLERAVRRGLDDVALELIRQKDRLTCDQKRIREELDQVIAEVDAAKGNLSHFRTEIHRLEREKVRVLASLASARARRRIQAAFEGLSTDVEEAALESVREEVARLRFEGGLDLENDDDELRARVRNLRDEARFEAHRRELEELKQHYRKRTRGSADARTAEAQGEIEGARSTYVDTQATADRDEVGSGAGSAAREGAGQDL